LNYRVVKTDDKNYCGDKFMKIVKERLCYFPWANLSLNWEIED
jgi:hypothetical protein